MRPKLTLIGALAATALAGGAAVAADQEAGVPLSPAEAAGGWTVEAGGQDVCMIRLTADHRVAPSVNCNSVMPNVTGWQPTADGMALTGPGGQQVVVFGRWSNSLLVAKHGDIRLMRGKSPQPGVSMAGINPGPRPYD